MSKRLAGGLKWHCPGGALSQTGPISGLRRIDAFARLCDSAGRVFPYSVTVSPNSPSRSCSISDVSNAPAASASRATMISACELRPGSSGRL